MEGGSGESSWKRWLKEEERLAVEMSPTFTSSSPSQLRSSVDLEDELRPPA